MDKQFFERRQDYHEQLAVHSFNKNEMRQCIYQVYDYNEETRDKMTKEMIENTKTRWLLNRYESRLNMAYEKALRIS